MYFGLNDQPKIRCIIFDWGGTLAYSDTRPKFLFGLNLIDRLESLYSDTIYTLRQLKRAGFYLGLITNTSHSVYSMVRSLNETGVNYFDFVVTSTETDTCKKPCSRIFTKGLRLLNSDLKIKITPAECLYVGNDYFKDIIGAYKNGLQTAYICRNNSVPNILFIIPPTYVISHISDVLKIVANY